MRQPNLLKKVAIVDECHDAFFIRDSRLSREIITKQVVCFLKASYLLRYLEKLKQNGRFDEFPDYILIDMKLPDMDATSFLDQLKQILRKADGPEVFIFSSAGNKKSRDLAMQYDFVSAYIEKPVPSDLIEVLVVGGGVDNSPQ